MKTPSCFKPLFILFFFFLISGSSRSSVYYWVGGNGNWADFATHWSTTSGGQIFHVQVPTPVDTVVFDSLSFDSAAQFVYCDSSIITCHTMIWQNVQFGPTFASQYISNGGIFKIYGSITLDTGLTWAYQGKIYMEALATGNTITCAGNTFFYLE